MKTTHHQQRPDRLRLVSGLVAVAVLALGGCSNDGSAPKHAATPTDASTDASAASSSLLVVLTLAGTDDPFVGSALDGARAVATRLHATLVVVRTTPDRLPQDVDAALARRPAIIVGVGGGTIDAIDPAAASNLDQQFVVVGAEAAEPTDNLTTAVLRDHEALHLTGVEAGLLSRGTVGVVAPPANPLVDAWVDTFASAARASGASVEVARTDEARDDVSDRVDDLIGRGADVVEGVLVDRGTVEGSPTTSVFGTGKEGCEADHVADSVVLDAGLALDRTVGDVLAGRPGGVHSFGLAEGGVSLASLDGDTSCAVTADREVLDRVRKARDAVVDGSVTVADPDFAP